MKAPVRVMALFLTKGHWTSKIHFERLNSRAMCGFSVNHTLAMAGVLFAVFYVAV